MRDVADHAGVSVKTVSNVVNGFRHVSDATRGRVQRSLDELGYQLNTTARNLRAGRTGMIALAVPELRQAYFAELAGAVMRHAERHGLVVLIEQTLDRPDRELAVLTGARSRLVDGVIFSPLELGPDEVAGARTDLPMVLLGERVGDAGLDRVGTDNVTAAREAVAHLVAIGRRRIAAIGVHPDEHVGSAALRLAGYTAALAAAGLPLRAKLLVTAGRWRRDSGAAAARELLDRGGAPDAIFCFNDMLALGALRELLRSGVRVPDDIALAGFDDVEEARFATPPLTTVAPGIDEIAATAVEMLRERIAGVAAPEPRVRTSRHRLVVRASTVGAAAVPAPVDRRGGSPR